MFLVKVSEKYDVVGAYLYGSYAKERFNQWSDIDLAIISPDFSEDLYDDRVELMRIAAAIDDRIEPRPYRTESFSSNDPLVAEIKRHGIQIEAN